MKHSIRFYLSIIYYIFAILWCKICRFFSVKEVLESNMQSGELIVIGQDRAEIRLGAHRPKAIVVGFKDECVIPPCSPHHYDTLKWELKNMHCGHKHDFWHDHSKHFDDYVLIIKWDVSAVRIIEWIAYYK